MTKNKTNEVTEGVMLFANALINDHHADAYDVYLSLAEECKRQVTLLLTTDPDPNR